MSKRSSFHIDSRTAHAARLARYSRRPAVPSETKVAWLIIVAMMLLAAEYLFCANHAAFCVHGVCF